MAEFETGGHTYRADKMSAREQLHLLRGLGPLFGPMVQLALIDSGQIDAAARQLAFMVPFFDAFAKMEEEDVNTLVNKCFTVTRRREGVNGASVWGPPLWSKAAGREQYDDIDLGSMMTICWQVIQENLGGFFAFGSALPVSGTETIPTQPASPGPAFQMTRTS